MRWPNPARLAQSPRWFAAFASATGLCLTVLAANVLVSDLSPSGSWGIGYGITCLISGAVMVNVGNDYTPKYRIDETGPALIYGGWSTIALGTLLTGVSLAFPSKTAPIVSHPRAGD